MILVVSWNAPEDYSDYRNAMFRGYSLAAVASASLAAYFVVLRLFFSMK
jgi:hypothetical protein